MTRSPSLSEIEAVELKLLASRRETSASLRRLRSALRETMVRPSSLALICGVAGIAGFWLARRPRLRTAASTAGLAVAATATAAGLVRAYVLRHGMHYLEIALRRLWTAQRKAG
jgi:hypothetical protein